MQTQHQLIFHLHFLNVTFVCLFQGTAIRDRIQERLRGQQYRLQNGKDGEDEDDDDYYYEDDSEEYYEEYYDDEELNPQNEEKKDVKN